MQRFYKPNLVIHYIFYDLYTKYIDNVLQIICNFLKSYFRPKINL